MREIPTLRATSIGPVAAEILRHAHELDVIAVFERSFYLMAPNGIVCVALDALGSGPINVLLKPQAGAQPWTGGLPAETKAVTSAGRLTVGRVFTVDLATALEWRPPPWPPVAISAVASGIAEVRRLAPDMLPSDGLAPLVFTHTTPAKRSPTMQAAASLIVGLMRALPIDIARGTWSADALRHATLLVGLGPGLTPSGDDLLGGMMMALTALDLSDVRDALWQTIGAELDDLTVPISAMHLAAAADGLGAQAMHHMIGAIVAGDVPTITSLLPTMRDIGATSGWDTLAGVVMTLDAWCPQPVA